MVSAGVRGQRRASVVGGKRRGGGHGACCSGNEQAASPAPSQLMESVESQTRVTSSLPSRWPPPGARTIPTSAMTTQSVYDLLRNPSLAEQHGHTHSKVLPFPAAPNLLPCSRLPAARSSKRASFPPLRFGPAANPRISCHVHPANHLPSEYPAPNDTIHESRNSLSYEPHSSPRAPSR